MTLGCKLSDTFVAQLKALYRTTLLMPAARMQMSTALSSNGYKTGEPYDFGSLGLIDTGSSKEADRECAAGIMGLNVVGTQFGMYVRQGDKFVKALPRPSKPKDIAEAKHKMELIRDETKHPKPAREEVNKAAPIREISKSIESGCGFCGKCEAE